MFRINNRRTRRSTVCSESMETLEVRRVPVGNITAALQNGVLTITGDNLGNDVAVQRPIANLVTVTGLEQTVVNGVAPVNGKSVVAFTGVTDVVIQTNDGNDKVRVNGPLFGRATFRDVTIDSGAGDDQVDIERAFVADDLNIFTKNGKDIVSLTQVIVGGSGADSNQNDLQINTARVTSGASDADTVKLNEVKVKRDLTITTGDDADIVLLQDPRALRPATAALAQPVIVGDDLSIDTGDAADKVTLNVVTVTDEVNIDLRNGDDSLRVIRTRADEANFDGGFGQDTLFLLDNLFQDFDEDSFEL